MRQLYQFKKEDAFNFAQSRHAELKRSGKELQFKYCPICNGGSGSKRDKYTFAINMETGACNCLRSSCRYTGNMITLARDFGFSLGREIDEYYQPRKQYKRLPTPKAPIVPKEPAIKYLESRKISPEIAKQYEVTTHKDHDNWLVFMFYDGDEKLQAIKYRKTDFDKTKDAAKEWFMKGCKPILFGMKQCNMKNKTLIVCEGQLDSLAVATAGFENAVSVPNGARGFTWIPYCHDWMMNFEEIIVFGDYEKGHITLLDDIRKRFPQKVRYVRPEGYKDCKDANELLMKYGKQAIDDAINNAVIMPIKRVVVTRDVQMADYSQMKKLRTNIDRLDVCLGGGLPFGAVCLITGKRGDGKLISDDTPVLTDCGWKTHGDLVVGDSVVGRNGEFVKVTHVFPKYYANMVVSLSNGEKIYCHENHEWVVTIASGSIYKEKILTTKEIYEKKQAKYTKIIRLIERRPIIGRPVELKVKPYTLGAWLGDGRNSYPDICSSERDMCVIYSVVNDDGYEISWQATHKDTGVRYFGFKGLRAGLREYNMCHAMKRKPKYIPEEYLYAPLQDRLELLAGLLDTDGYLDRARNRYTYSTTEETLRDSFMDLVRTFGWNCGYSTYEPTVSSSGIHGRKNVYNINFTPRGLIIPCRVPRKQLTEIKGFSYGHVTIQKVGYCNHKSGNCIEVEGGIYCVGKTIIPTHNSCFATNIMTGAIDQGFSTLIYSGEMRKDHVKRSLVLQAAGRKHIATNETHFGMQRVVTPHNMELIDRWFGEKSYLYDSDCVDNEHEDLLNTIEDAIQQYGVEVILLDNLMTAMYLNDDRSYDKYDRQGKFVRRLAEIAVLYDVLIILVAHRRKSAIVTDANDEVSGSSDITNLAGVVISYDRPNNKEIEDGTLDEDQRKIILSKNRFFGTLEYKGIVVDYDPVSTRVFDASEENNGMLTHEYGWTGNENNGFMGLDDDSDNPFMT